jgi:hypothetical protein
MPYTSFPPFPHHLSTKGGASLALHTDPICSYSHKATPTIATSKKPGTETLRLMSCRHSYFPVLILLIEVPLYSTTTPCTISSAYRSRYASYLAATFNITIQAAQLEVDCQLEPRRNSDTSEAESYRSE